MQKSGVAQVLKLLKAFKLESLCCIPLTQGLGLSRMGYICTLLAVTTTTCQLPNPAALQKLRFPKKKIKKNFPKLFQTMRKWEVSGHTSEILVASHQISMVGVISGFFGTFFEKKIHRPCAIYGKSKNRTP